MSLRSEFRIVISAQKRCLVRPYMYLQLFVRGLMSYLCYLCLFAYSGVQHILCCVFVSFFFVLLPVSHDCLMLLPLWFYLTFFLYCSKIYIFDNKTYICLSLFHMYSFSLYQSSNLHGSPTTGGSSFINCISYII